jgi:hypothetical protein
VDFLKDHWPYNVDDLGELAIKKQTDSFWLAYQLLLG